MTDYWLLANLIASTRTAYLPHSLRWGKSHRQWGYLSYMATHMLTNSPSPYQPQFEMIGFCDTSTVNVVSSVPIPSLPPSKEIL